MNYFVLFTHDLKLFVPEETLTVVVLTALLSIPLYTFYNSGMSSLKSDQKNIPIYTFVLGLLFLSFRFIKAFLRYFDMNYVCLNVGFPIHVDFILFCSLSTFYFISHIFIVRFLINHKIFQELFFCFLKIEDLFISLNYHLRMIFWLLVGFFGASFFFSFEKDLLIFLGLLAFRQVYINLRNLVTEDIYQKNFSQGGEYNFNNFTGDVLFESLNSPLILLVGGPLQNQLSNRSRKAEYNKLVRRYILKRASQIIKSTGQKVFEVAKDKPEVGNVMAGVGASIWWATDQHDRMLARKRESELDKQAAEDRAAATRRQAAEDVRKAAEESRKIEDHKSLMRSRHLDQELTLAKIDALKKPGFLGRFWPCPAEDSFSQKVLKFLNNLFSIFS